MKWLRLIVIMLVVFLLGCASNPPKKRPYVEVPALSKGDLHVDNIRLQAIRDTALSVGAQGGLAWRSHQIDTMLLESQNHLDQIFNFNAVMLKHNVLPPVLVEGRNTLNLANTQAIRLADRIYKIQSPPHFVTAAPTWRD